MKSSKARKLKRHAQRIHFRKRVKDRLGYDIQPDEVRRIRQEIQSGTGVLLTRPDKRLSVWRTKIGNRTGFVVVWDAETEELVTLMTDAIWQQQDMCNSPYVEDDAALKGSFSEARGAESLLALKSKLEGK